MIKSIVRAAPSFSTKQEVVVVPLFEGEKQLAGSVKKLDVLSRGVFGRELKRGRFTAANGETMLVALGLPRTPEHVMLLGLGKRASLSAEATARAGASASNAVKVARLKTCHVIVDEAAAPQLVEHLHTFLKGFLVAQYAFKITKERLPTGVRKLTLLATASPLITAAIRSARVVSEETATVRDLVNLPANHLGPSELAKRARALAREHGIGYRAMGRAQLKKIGMGAVLAVAQGSEEEPRFIELEYKGRKGAPRVCLVGKAVTFDSGGISIKPWQNMNEMKGDMAGGAVVMGAMAAAARMKLPVNIIGLIPCVENMPSGSAFRPGDVITTYSGKTIEILSTDAEGRLILADALTYACERKPDLIVDFATLTGAVVIALGTRVAAVMGNNQSYIDGLVAAGKQAAEPVWQLPLDDNFSKAVKGDISDYKNYSGRDGSSITAGALLGEFVGKTPWMHVDIAGTFWSENQSAPHFAKGATGYGVDLTVRFLQSLA